MKIITVSETRGWYTKSTKSPYLTVFVRVSPSLAREVCRVRDELRRVDSRHVYVPSRHLHLTVKELGWLGGDVKEENLGRVLKVAREVAAGHAPFPLEVDGVGAFSTVVYGSVGAGSAELQKMNSELVERLGAMAAQSRYDGEDMVPHVTIAHFAAKDVGLLLARSEAFASRSIGKMVVREIRVAKWYPHLLFGSPRPLAGVRVPMAKFALGDR